MNLTVLIDDFKKEPVITGYLAAEGFEAQTADALGSDVFAEFGRLFLCRGPVKFCPWAQNVWSNPKISQVSSIKDAAKKLAAVQRNWWPYQHTFARRMELIQKELPYVSAKEMEFPSEIPVASLGSWTLIDMGWILYSDQCSSKFPNGEMRFKENHTDPPSRAYLKLWEALSIATKRPKPGDMCLDLGACPGGWTWVLRGLGAKVIAVDRSPLADKLMKDPLVEYRMESAFACQPQNFDGIDWIFSDVICYPERLLELVTRWYKSGKCKNFVCTLKFQSRGSYQIVDRFMEIPGSQVMHLSHNKHELTWIRLEN